MPKISICNVPEESGSNYPPPFNVPCAAQASRRLARFAGISQFGVNLTVLAPGAWSSQRHWHTHEDEFVWVLEGEVTLVTDSGPEILQAGDFAAFPAGRPDGHHFINHSAHPVRLLEIGTSNNQDVCTYADIDMVTDGANGAYAHKDGRPYRT